MIGVGGLLVSTIAAFRILGVRHRPSEAFDPRRLAEDLTDNGQLHDETAFYRAMIAHVGKEVDDHSDTIGRLSNTVTAMLWGILVMLCGLALAALVG